MNEPAPIAHLTTVDLSLRFLLLPQLEAPLSVGIPSMGISAPGPWVSALEAHGIRHLALPASTRGMSLKADLRSAFDLYRHLRAVRPAILHTHNPKPGLYGRIVGRLAGVPIVVNTVHGLYAAPDDPLAKRFLVYALEAVASRFSHAELVQSREDTELMRRLRLAPPANIAHLGNGIDLSRFSDSISRNEVRRRVRSELGVSDDQVLIGMVGRMVREKGYLELFDAAERLDPRFRVVCVGPADPEKADAVPAEAVARAAEMGVIFLGMREDVADLYAAMDVFVLPSHREGFPRAAMEAAASGLPIIATDIRGCREVVDHEVNGLLVPVGDPQALASAIRRLGDSGERKRMGAAGRKKSERDFDERRVVHRVMSTYLRLVRLHGVSELAPFLGRLVDSGVVKIRSADAADAAFIARAHRSSIQTGFLPRLGQRFMEVLYRTMVVDEGSVVLVAEDDTGPVGFVAGTQSTSSFYRRFIRRAGIRVLLAAGPRLLRPSFVRRVVESLRYGSEPGAEGAELLSMAVVTDRRGEGIGLALGQALLERLHASTVRVVVGSSNVAAIAAYGRMGFGRVGTIEVHRGERSEVLEWLQS